MKRGLIIDVSEKAGNSLILFTLWLLGVLNRYKIFDTLCIGVVSGVVALCLLDVRAFFAGVLFYEIFLFSIAFHEACHMKCGMLFGNPSTRIMLIPTEFGLRTGFDKRKQMTELEFAVVLFAGPMTPLLVSLPILLVLFALNQNIFFLIILILFVFINLMSILPLKGSDGMRVIKYIKKNKANIKRFLVTYFIFLLWNFKIMQMDVGKNDI